MVAGGDGRVAQCDSAEYQSILFFYSKIKLMKKIAKNKRHNKPKLVQ